MNDENVVAVSGLVKTFGKSRALDRLDLSVRSGEVHGFLGPNGAGKPTTLRALLGLIRKDSGEARLLGGDPWRDAVALHRRLAYVPGDVTLWPGLTGGEVIDRRGCVRLLCHRALRAAGPGERTTADAAGSGGGGGLAAGAAGPRLAAAAGSLIAWTLGFAALGAILGGIAEGGVEVIRNNPKLEVVVGRLGGSSGIADTYFAAIMGLLGLIAAGYAIGAALRLRNEETSGRVEPVLATPVSRQRWAASHLAFAILGSVLLMGVAGITAGLAYGLSTGDVGGDLGRVLSQALVQLPAVWVLVGASAALFGLLPRLAAPVDWAVLAACVPLEEFGRPLQLSKRVLDLSPFAYVPKLPADGVLAAPLVWLVLISAVLLAAGLLGLRRRDVF